MEFVGGGGNVDYIETECNSDYRSEERKEGDVGQRVQTHSYIDEFV